MDASRPLRRDRGRALSLDCFNVVGWQHAGLAGTLNSTIHPAFVDGLHVDDDVAVLEGHLVTVGCGVVIHGTHGFLKERSPTQRETDTRDKQAEILNPASFLQAIK